MRTLQSHLLLRPSLFRRTDKWVEEKHGGKEGEGEEEKKGRENGKEKTNDS